MAISPYDNLPTGMGSQDPENINQSAETAPAVEKNVGDANVIDTNADEHSRDDASDYDRSDDGLRYVDVPLSGTPEDAAEDFVDGADESAGETDEKHPEEEHAEEDAAGEFEIILPDEADAPREGPIAASLPKRGRGSTVSAPPRRENHDLTTVTPPDFAPQYSKIRLQNLWTTGEYLLPFEETLLVPDTMPDMETVLFAEGSVSLVQPAKTSYEKNDPISGELLIYTVYKPAAASTSPIDVVKSSVPFKTDKWWENTEGDAFRICVSVSSVSAEMLNERKFIIKGTITIRFTETAQKELMAFAGTGDDALVQKESSITATDLIFETSESTEISQEISLRDEHPAPIKILKESFNVIENHKQITSGKLVINGTILSSILYLGEDDDKRRLCCLNNKTDFTQFVPVDNDMDAELIRICFAADNMRASIESRDMFMIQGQVVTNIYACKNRSLTMVSDIYHKTRDVRFDVSEQPISSVAGTVSGEISSREVVNIDEGEQKPETLLCGTARITDISGKAERGRIVIDGTVAVMILALNEDDEPFLISSSVPLRGSLELDGSFEGLETDISAAVKEFWFDSINSRQMEINISVCLDVWTFDRDVFRTVEDLRFVESGKPQRHIPMAIYVVGEGDTLWDIAKRYKSDSDTLARLNHLEPDGALTEGMKLLIVK